MKYADKTKLRRKPMNMTIREDIIAETKAYNINASEVAEAALAVAITGAKKQAWSEENKSAIAAYNKRIDHEGLFLKPYWMDNN